MGKRPRDELPRPRDLDLGYLGTYCDDRQDAVERLLLDPAHWTPARRFAIAERLPPGARPGFYARQRFTLNVTRAPSVRLLEAAACGVPVISDACEGLAASFEPGRDVLVAQTAATCSTTSPCPSRSGTRSAGAPASAFSVNTPPRTARARAAARRRL